ncbi:MAG: LysM peptidoglycan-binding domain-containing protein [Planctomycetes bacterium]|nr:LysM peptidoglycan-binding domain-containing protein [Planctomycetota bacterium]
MGNLEKYGVLALIFVIVLILTVAIWNGPGDAAKRAQKQQQLAQVDPSQNNNINNPSGQPGAGVKPETFGVTNDDLKIRPALADQIKKQQEEEARLAALHNNTPGGVSVGGAVVPGGSPEKKDAQPAVEKNPSFRKYKIVKGDTLQSIAGKQLGSKNRWEEILRANEGINPTKLKVNTDILIPGKSAESLASNDASKNELHAAKKDKKDSELAKSSR